MPPFAFEPLEIYEIETHPLRLGSSDRMGRTSKFLFPVPGRRYNATTREMVIEPADFPAPARSPVSAKLFAAQRLSKAQRILGPDSDLNIDSPIRDDDILSWYPSSRSSDMSISVSESSQSMQSTNGTSSFQKSLPEQAEHEPGVLPASPMRGKASSTLLGHTYGDDTAADASSGSRRMRHEDSSSTLKSYYDRQKSPLAISQQTSDSSARDLALRKGYPSVVSRMPKSPLLKLESSVDVFDDQFVGGLHNREDLSQNQSTEKKPTRLDLSKLFPQRNRRGSKAPNSDLRSPSPVYFNAPIIHTSQTPPDRRKLTTAQLKEALRSPEPASIKSTKHYSTRPQRHETLSKLYDSYEKLVLSAALSQIPESSVPGPEPEGRDSRDRLKSRDGQSRPENDSYARRISGFSAQPGQLHRKEQNPVNTTEESCSWNHVPENVVSPKWDSSAASVSSRNTKTSRHTDTSAFSNTDLKRSSVLSLSSDSEEEVSDLELGRVLDESSKDKPSSVPNEGTSRLVQARRQSLQPPERVGFRKQSSRRGAAQASPFLTIPETSATSSRLSGPWSPPELEEPLTAAPTGPSDQRENRSKRRPPTSSKRSSSQSTPPQSPNPRASADAETDSSRLMAVTKQEEALLEALRNKRARMRERIIQEHETQKSPPLSPISNVSRHSEGSQGSSLRGHEAPKQKHKILLYLDTPLNDSHLLDTAEPSQDLSNFLSCASDDDTTPRTSWAAPPRRGRPRPESSAVSLNAESQASSRDNPPGARLSAVGAAAGFRDERSSDPTLVTRKRNTNAGVRFVDDAKLGRPRGHSLDEHEEGVIWGM